MFGRGKNPLKKFALPLANMSNVTYTGIRKPLVWLHGEIRTPPFSRAARIEAGFLLRRLQEGESLGMPAVRPMPSIGPGCYELRINDGGIAWRLLYAIDTEAVVILDVFSKKTRSTPDHVLNVARKRLREYQRLTREVNDEKR